MAYDFSKFDQVTDLEGLKKDIAEANANGDFPEVPLGDYEVKITKLELGVSKSDKPMFKCWFKILSGDYKGSLLFMNQVVTQGFQIHIVDDFLRSLESGMAIMFESYAQYAELIMDVFEAIDDAKEYAIEYGNDNGFSTFKVTEVFDLE